MRDIFHDELDDIGKRVLEMTTLVGITMQKATQALFGANLTLADEVDREAKRVDALAGECEDRSFQLIAQQQPVATDLRVLISTVHLAADLQRMGTLANHVAKIARLRHPEVAVPPEAHDVISQMGEVATALVDKVHDVVEGRDIALAQAIESEDDSMDALRRKLFLVVLSDNWTRGTAAAIDVALLGRYYERYADHAVAVARQTIFIVTGEHPHQFR